MKIYKYILEAKTNQPEQIVINGDLLGIEQQGKDFVVYFAVNESIKSVYEIVLCETGAEIPNHVWFYSKSFMLFGGAYVLHAMWREVETTYV